MFYRHFSIKYIPAILLYFFLLMVSGSFCSWPTFFIIPVVLNLFCIYLFLSQIPLKYTNILGLFPGKKIKIHYTHTKFCTIFKVFDRNPKISLCNTDLLNLGYLTHPNQIILILFRVIKKNSGLKKANTHFDFYMFY